MSELNEEKDLEIAKDPKPKKKKNKPIEVKEETPVEEVKPEPIVWRGTKF